MTQDEAKQRYRDAWEIFRNSTSESIRKDMMKKMDYCQVFIAPHPNEEWKEFTATLNGYVEFWRDWMESALSTLKSGN